MQDIFAHLPQNKIAEAQALDTLFREVTGWQPKLWGKTIGYGQYHYKYDSGREGDFLATGCAMRSRDISLHILPGYSEFPEIAKRLGPHKRGRSCWYVKALNKENQAVIGDLIRAGLEDLEGFHRILPT